MPNYTTEIYEMKREIMRYSQKMTLGLSKPTGKFVTDMVYGIHKSGSGMLSDISRALDEGKKLNYTIDRLSTNLVELTEEEKVILWHNYLEEVKKELPEEPIFLFDDTDIAKPYGRAFEDLDRVIDGSTGNKETVKGYNVCECVVLGGKEKQAFSIYSEIYSTKSHGFSSRNNYSLKSIKAAREIAGDKEITCVLDRFYDNHLIIEELDKEKTTFIIRLKDNRYFLFKNRRKKASEVVKQRKGKIKMTLLFDDNEEHDVYISHTRAVLPHNSKEYTIVMVYGLSEERPMMLLTNKRVKSKEEVISIVRHYMYRWRIEEYFRVKKQEYGFENMRVRSLKGMNNLNLMSTMVLGHVGKLAESINSKLLSIKIVVESRSLKSKVLFWYYQMARGIRRILSQAKTGLSKLQDIESRSSVIQLKLRL